MACSHLRKLPYAETHPPCCVLFPPLTPCEAACLTGHDAVCFNQKISGYYVGIILLNAAEMLY